MLLNKRPFSHQSEQGRQASLKLWSAHDPLPPWAAACPLDDRELRAAEQKSPHTKWARNSPAPRRGRRRNPAATRRRRSRRNSAASRRGRSRNSAANRRGRSRNSAANRRGRRRNSEATKDEEEDGNSDALRLGRRCRRWRCN